MNTVTLEALTEKLRGLPNEVLLKVWGYTDALLERKNMMFELSEEQKKHLLKQNDIPLEECFEADVALEKLKQKYEL